MIEEYIKKHKIIGLDTMIFIYHFEANPIYSPLTKIIFKSIQSGKLQGITSSLSIMEILVKPLKTGNYIAARDYELVMLNIPNLTIIPFDSSIASKGAFLRAKYDLKTPDAIQIATSIGSDGTAFITNDLKFKKIKDIEIIILDSLLHNYS